MKRNYNGLDFSLVIADIESPILRGSLTSVPIKINSVEVEDYKQGFDIGQDHQDFQEISFD